MLLLHRYKMFLDALKIEILFYSMINMKLNFYFNIINLKYEHFHENLSKFYKFASFCKKCPIL
jgi:hypothetical protein